MKPAVHLAALATLLLAGCAAQEVQTVATIPATLGVPDNQVLVGEAMASGVQIYTCSNTNGQYEWVFKAPQADLYDRNGRRIGKHYAGPTWESIDGSKVVGEIKSRNDAPDPNAIAWLLLSARANEGRGVFGTVQSIQRVNTAAGKPPHQSCNGTNLNQSAAMDYRATYYFYRNK